MGRAALAGCRTRLTECPRRSASAHERGGTDLATVPPAVLSLPFDLMRHDLLMTLKPVPATRITVIIDELCLPLPAVYRR